MSCPSSSVDPSLVDRTDLLRQHGANLQCLSEEVCRLSRCRRLYPKSIPTCFFVNRLKYFRIYPSDWWRRWMETALVEVYSGSSPDWFHSARYRSFWSADFLAFDHCCDEGISYFDFSFVVALILFIVEVGNEAKGVSLLRSFRRSIFTRGCTAPSVTVVGWSKRESYSVPRESILSCYCVWCNESKRRPWVPLQCIDIVPPAKGIPRRFRTVLPTTKYDPDGTGPVENCHEDFEGDRDVVARPVKTSKAVHNYYFITKK